MNNVERNELLQLAGSVASGFVAATGVAQDEQGIAKFSLSVARELIAQVDYTPPEPAKSVYVKGIVNHEKGEATLLITTPKRGRKPKA